MNGHNDPSASESFAMQEARSAAQQAIISVMEQRWQIAGRAAYEAFVMEDAGTLSWRVLPEATRDRWVYAAQAAHAAFFGISVP